MSGLLRARLCTNSKISVDGVPGYPNMPLMPASIAANPTASSPRRSSLMIPLSLAATAAGSRRNRLEKRILFNGRDDRDRPVASMTARRTEAPTTATA